MSEEPTIRYWIQDIAPNGEYRDSIGMDPKTTREMAVRELAEWQRAYPANRSRLVVRTDVVIKD